MRSARTSRMRALVCDVSVTIPACEPDSEIASVPRSWIAIAQSAQEIRSPVESSMSISRGCGSGETSWAIATSSSVVLPRAESTATTPVPSSSRAHDPLGGALDALGVGDGGAAELHDDDGPVRRFAIDRAARRGRYRRAAAGERLAERDLVGVLEVGAHREPAGEPRDRHLRPSSRSASAM